MNFLNNLGPILTAIALVIGAVGIYIQRRARNIDTYANGWERYAKQLEADNLRKDTTISNQSIKIGLLEAELAKFRRVDVKIEEAKDVLHQTVDTKLDDIKS